jgi:hypothetical protein
MFIKLIIKLLSIFDFFQKKKIIDFFINQKITYLDNFFDVGSHYGETICYLIDILKSIISIHSKLLQ